MSFLSRNWWRFAVSIAWDGVDFIIGRLPLIGIIVDVTGVFIAVWLWESRGWFAGLEVLEVTDQVDAWVPSVTLIGLSHWWSASR